MWPELYRNCIKKARYFYMYDTNPLHIPLLDSHAVYTDSSPPPITISTY